MNTTTFWPGWLKRLDRVVMDSSRLLGTISSLTTIHISLIKDAKRRLMLLIGELKLLNRNVIGNNSRRATDLIQDLQAALETAVLHTEKTVTDCRGDAGVVSNDRSLNLISAALGNIELSGHSACASAQGTGSCIGRSAT